LLRITGACARLGVDGVRGDIVSARAAQALAALDAADEVSEEHVRRAAALALAHRRRRDPLDGTTGTPADLERALDGEDPTTPRPVARGGSAAPPARTDPRPPAPQSLPPAAGPPGQAPAARASEQGARFSPDAPALRAPRRPGARGVPAPRTDHPLVSAPARSAAAARTCGPAAGAIDSRPAGPGATDIALVATLRARLLGGRAPTRARPRRA